MKYLMLVILAMLVAASLAVSLNMPDHRGDVPVLYWVTEAGEVRVGQQQVFDRWIAAKHREDPVRYPLFRIVIDPANNREEKIMIQGVTGVAGDLPSASRGGFRYFRTLGLLDDVTDVARQRGFDPSTTFPQLYWECTMDGRQYGYPMNVTVPLYIVNVKTFEQYGIDPPRPNHERIWTIEEFEAKGQAFMAAVEKRGRRGLTFYADKFELLPLRRSFGLNTFNETGTACVLDDPRYIRTLDLMYKWTYTDHLFPSAGEQDSLTGGIPGQFANGGYAMFMEGSWVLEQFRPKAGRKVLYPFARGDMTAMPLPYHAGTGAGDAGLPNTILRSRIAGVYSGGKHRELAAIFLEFLASPEYGRQLVDVPDSLPPNPRLSEAGDPLSEPFFKPQPTDDAGRVIAGREHELDYEAPADAEFAWAMRELAIGTNYSPFVLPATVGRIENLNYMDFMKDRFPAAEAARRTTRELNAEIQRNVEGNPRLQAEYQRRKELQARIDQRKAAGEKIPLAWQDDPFYRKYYWNRGMIEGEGPWWKVPGGNVPATRGGRP